MRPVKSMLFFILLWGQGCESVCLLPFGISVAKQTEAMYGAECNNHTPQ